MEESLSSYLIRKGGAWKCKAVELQMDKFAKQNRQRMRRLENMQRHADQQAEKQMRAEKLWNNILKRGENAQRRLQHNREMEKNRKKAAYTKRMEERIADEQIATQNKSALFEKNKAIHERRQEKLRLEMEKARQLKASRAREKQQKRQERLRHVRFAEEQKQAVLRQQWATKEERTGQFLELEREKRKVAKVARDLKSQAKSNRIMQMRKQILDDRRRKTAAKIDKLYRKAEILDDIEYATNEELKEFARLQWINKQRLKKPTETSPGPGTYFNADTQITKRKIKSEPLGSGGNGNYNKQLPGSFPSLSQTRSKLKKLISPIMVKRSAAWSNNDNTPRGSLPVSDLYSYK